MGRGERHQRQARGVPGLGRALLCALRRLRRSHEAGGLAREWELSSPVGLAGIRIPLIWLGVRRIRFVLLMVG